MDVGFYVFHLPFYELLQSSLMVLAALTLAIVLLSYGYLGLLRMRGARGIAISGKAISHLSMLLVILVADWGFGLYLDH